MIAALDDLGLELLAFLAVALGWIAFAGVLGRWIDARRQRALGYQRMLHADRPPALSIWGAPVIAAVLFALLGLVGAWIAGLVVGFVLYKFLDHRPKRAVAARAHKFDSQLADTLVGLSNSLKAGLSLPQAIEQIGRDMPAPTAEEFDQAFREYEHGKTIEQSFEDIRERVESRNYGLAVAAFRVGKERGGNLATVFEKIATSIREIWRLEEHIKTVTTAGRSSARFMTLMPAVFLVLLYLMDPDSMSLLFTDPLGIGVLTGVFLINVLCHVWIRRILAVDV